MGCDVKCPPGREQCTSCSMENVSYYPSQEHIYSGVPEKCSRCGADLNAEVCMVCGLPRGKPGLIEFCRSIRCRWLENDEKINEKCRGYFARQYNKFLKCRGCLAWQYNKFLNRQ